MSGKPNAARGAGKDSAGRRGAPARYKGRRARVAARTVSPPDPRRPMDAPTRTLLVSVQMCFAVFPIAGKVAMEAFAPPAVLVWRLGVGSAVLLGLASWLYGRGAWPPARELLPIARLSLFGIAINQWLFLEGLSRSTAVNAGLLMTVIPVATTAFAAALGHETLGARRAAGIALSVTGVAILFGTRGARLGGGTALGDGLLVLNTLSYSLYLVLAKPVLRRTPHLVVVAWMFVASALVMPWFFTHLDWAPAHAGGRQWWGLAGVLVFPTVLAYVGNTVVLSRTRASTTATYVMLQPVITSVLGVVLLGEAFGPWLLVVATCVLGGLWLVSARRPRARAPATR